MTPAVTPKTAPDLESLERRIARLEQAQRSAMDILLQLLRTLGPIAGAVDKLRQIGLDES
jgi:hypothetical protein